MKMGSRRLSREIALRILFQFEAGEKLSPSDSFAVFCGSFNPCDDIDQSMECGDEVFQDALPFARELFTGVTDHLKELDQVLESASENWRLDRMSRVDRNVLRLAMFELMFRDDIPSKVSINEAIDLGKAYGSEDSGAFINGILDRVHRQMTTEGKIVPAGANGAEKA